MKQNKFLKKQILFICLLIFTSITIHGQTTVNGTINSSEDKMPIIGATIVVKGSKKGVNSDFDGKYTLNNVSPKDVLVIGFLGFKTVEITVGNKSVIDVVLQVDAQSLNEVVVVGYGTSKKSDVTGAIASVSSKDFEKQPLTDVSKAIQGRAAGVQVRQTSGSPSGGFNIRIRGANSITGGNDPLYVVDGQFISDLSTVNVNDIQSMEILKDASATAIYGTRGANGVVLVTTKKGRSGKTKISVDVFKSISNVYKKLDLLSPSEFAEGVNFAEGQIFYTQAEIDALKVGGGEDWQDRLFSTGIANNAQLSASGGSDTVDYYISGNLLNSSGTVVSQDYTRANLRVNLNAKLTDKFKIGVNFNGGFEKLIGDRADVSTGISWDPTTPAYKADGTYNFLPIKSGVATASKNVLVAVENNIQDNNENRLAVNGYLNYDISKDLVFNSSAGIIKADAHNNSYNPFITSSIGIANVRNIYSTKLFNTNRLTYTKDINEKNNIKVDVIQESVNERFDNTLIYASNFFTDLVSYNDLTVASVYKVSNSPQSRQLNSYLGRINYSLLDRYLLTLSYRADGTSVFQKDKWGYFPSASLAWKVSDEIFMKDNEVINNLKMRLSYGVVGNQGIPIFGTRSRAVLDPAVNYAFNGALVVGAAPSNRLANPDLTWETTKQINGGFDLGLWNSALTLSFDYYRKTTSDLLLDTQLPSYVGPTRRYVNAGVVENKGFDITLGARILKNKNWNINSTLSISHNKNKVLSLYDDVQYIEVGDAIRQNTFPVKPTRVEVGLPINTFRGFIFEGVYQLGEEAQGIPGKAKYRDISGPNGVPDGLITTDDITNVGSGNPDFTWGWNWDVNYKNWNINFLLTGSQGNDIYNFQRARLMALGALQFHAVYGDYRDRWTPTNPSNIPSSRDGTQILSTQFLEDGSFVAMKNIALGYNFKNDFLEKSGIDKLRVFASVENLFILTKYTGFDPESTFSSINQDADAGIDYNSYPNNRTFTFGINIGF